jgi:hypothetical protein
LVQGVFHLLEVPAMYAIRMDVDPRLRTNDALRRYARMEFGREDAAWILASARSANKNARIRSLRPRFLNRRVPPTHAMVACKGAPGTQTEETPTLV